MFHSTSHRRQACSRSTRSPMTRRWFSLRSLTKVATTLTRSLARRLPSSLPETNCHSSSNSHKKCEHQNHPISAHMFRFDFIVHHLSLVYSRHRRSSAAASNNTCCSSLRRTAMSSRKHSKTTAQPHKSSRDRCL